MGSQLAREALRFWATFGAVVLLLGAVVLPFWGRIAACLLRFLAGDLTDEDWPEDEP